MKLNGLLSNLKIHANGIRYVDPPNTFPKPEDYLLVRSRDVYHGKNCKFLVPRDGEWTEVK